MDDLLYKDVFVEWWSYHKMFLREASIVRQEQCLKAHVLPFFGAFPINDISVEIVNIFLAEKSLHGSPTRHPGPLAPSTIRKLCGLLRQSLAWAYSRGYADVPVFEGIRYSEGQTHQIPIFRLDEIPKLVAAAKPQWIADIIEISFRTGLRRGEIFGLRWSDVDFNACTLTVQRNVVSTRAGERSVGPPKTARSARIVGYDTRTAEILERRKKGAVTEWVVENMYGRPISPWYVVGHMTKTCDRAGIPRRGFHALRHTHASVLISHAETMDALLEIRDHLGHGSIDTTLQTYGHLLGKPTIDIPGIFDDL